MQAVKGVKMATEEELYQIISRAVVDKEFRSRLTRDPEKASAEMGYTVSDLQIAALKGTEPSCQAGPLEKRISKGWIF